MKRHIIIPLCLAPLIAAALEVTLPAAGTLKDYITPEQQETVTSLKVNGDINGDDLRIIRHMIGAQVSSDNGRYAEVDSGACRVLDLSEANIIGEGFYTFKYVPKPKEGPAYYLPGMAVEANTITYAMFCGSRVETLILPNSVTYIGCTHRGTTINDRCIDGSRLRSVTLPAQLEHMAVYGTGLALRHRDEGPDYYEEVPQSNLLASPALAEVKIADTNPHFKLIDGVLYSGDLTELMLCPPKREGKLDIPAETTKIGYRACAATHITGDLTITAPDIAAEAFSEATIDGNVTANGIGVIPQRCFYQATIIGNLTPAGKIREDAFCNATVRGVLNLSNVTDSIKACAFYGLKGNDFEVTIPKAVFYIGESAFYGASTTGTLTIPETVRILCVYAFAYNSFQNININSRTKYLYEYSEINGEDYVKVGVVAKDPFSWNSNVEVIDIPKDMTIVPYCLFSNCKKLRTINFQQECEHLTFQPGAFSGCDAITDIVLPPVSKKLSMGPYAFFRSDYDRSHRRIFIPLNTDRRLIVNQDCYTPNDTLFVWLTPDNINIQIRYLDSRYSDITDNYITNTNYGIHFIPWKNYGYYDIDYHRDGSSNLYGPTPEERPGSGVLYVPKGCRDKLISLLNSHITTGYDGPHYQEYRNYPSWLFFKEIREFTDLGYPNYSLDDSSVEGVSKESTPAHQVARYDISGRILEKPVQGVNIVKFSDGTIKKEIIR